MTSAESFTGAQATLRALPVGGKRAHRIAKRLRPETDGAALARELGILSWLRHPHLARLIRHYFDDAGHLVLVERMERGQPLDRVASLDADGLCAVITQIASALAALHQCGIVHGDVKSANIVVDTGSTPPRATLVDLGLSVRIGVRLIGGTPGHLAPEALIGGLAAPAIDCFALGVTLGDCLSRWPAAASAELAFMQRALTASAPQSRPSPRELKSAIALPVRLSRFAARAWLAALPRVDRMGANARAHTDAIVDAQRNVSANSNAHVSAGSNASTSASASAATDAADIVGIRGLPGAGRVREALWRSAVSAGLPRVDDARKRRRAGRWIDLRPWRAARIAALLGTIDSAALNVDRWARALALHTGGLPGDVLATLVACHAEGTIDLGDDPFDLPPPRVLSLAPAAPRRLARALSRRKSAAGTRRALLVLALAELPLAGAEVAVIARCTRIESAIAIKILRRAAIPIARAKQEPWHDSRARWRIPRMAARTLANRASPRQVRRTHGRIAAWLRRTQRNAPAVAASSDALAAAHATALVGSRRLRLATQALSLVLSHSIVCRADRVAGATVLTATTAADRLEWLEGLASLAAASGARPCGRFNSAIDRAITSECATLGMRRRAARVKERCADAPAAIETATARAARAWKAGEIAAASQALAEAEASGLGSDEERILHARLAAQIAAAGDDAASAIAGLERSAALAAAAGLPAEEAMSLANLSTLLLERGRFDPALAAALRANTQAEASGNLRARALATSASARIQRERADFAGALASMRRALALARAAEDDELTMSLANGAGIIAKRAGDRRRAERCYQIAAGSWADLASRRSAIAARLNLAVLRRDRGDVTGAREEIEEVLARLGDEHQPYRARSLALLADLWLRSDDAAQAVALGRRALAAFEELKAPEGMATAELVLAEAALTTGDHSAARLACERARGHAARAASRNLLVEIAILDLRITLSSSDRERARAQHADLEALEKSSGDFKREQMIAWRLALASWHLDAPRPDRNAAEQLLGESVALLRIDTPLPLLGEARRLEGLIHARATLKRQRTEPAPVPPNLNAALAAVLAHERLRLARSGGRTILLHIARSVDEALTAALAGLGSIFRVDVASTVLLLNSGEGDALATAIDRIALLAPRDAVGWACAPDDGGDCDALIRAAIARGGEAPPRRWLARANALGGAARDLPSPDDSRVVLGLLGRLLANPRSLEHTLELTLELLAGALGARRGFVVIELKEDPTRARIIAARGGAGIDSSGLGLQEISQSIIEETIASGRPVLIADAIADPVLGARESVQRLSIRSLLCVPIEDESGVLGALYLDDDECVHAFGEGELELALAFARRACGVIRQAREVAETHARMDEMRRQLGEPRACPEIIGKSRAITEIIDRIPRIAASEASVLVTGPSGSGKELIARALHRFSPRVVGPFVAVNVSALPDSLLESELFGHARGAFSGADREHSGLFESADGGTLFLDEVGDMSPAMQARLLRALETRRVRRVGENHEREVDLRIIAATNRDLEAMAATGAFRADLLYRLRVVHLAIPALAERKGDVPLLVFALLTSLAAEAGRAAPRLSPAALHALERHHWPGNVRELQNELRRALIFARDSLEIEHLSPVLSTPQATQAIQAAALTAPAFGFADGAALDSRYGVTLAQARLAFERDFLVLALERDDGVIARAARRLDIDRGQLSRMLERHGLRSPRRPS